MCDINEMSVTLRLHGRFLIISAVGEFKGTSEIIE